METSRSIEVIYTGGGIWLACCYVSKHVYAVYSNDCPDCLSLYDHRAEDPDMDYPCQNWIGDKETADMSRAELALFKMMKHKFNKQSW